MQLTEPQKEGLEQLQNFVRGNDRFFLLTGYAGTGKTTLINSFIEWYLDNKKIVLDDLVVTAPTNKAVRVLKRMTKNSADYKTLHSLLGLKHQIDANGNEVFKRDGKTKPTLYLYGCVIVDEASMIDDEIFDMIVNEARDHKIIFVGDPAQIPPVNHFHSKPMMPDVQKKFGFEKFHLSDIIRQAADNPIIQTSMDVRTGIFERTVKDDRDENGHGVFQMNLKDRQLILDEIKNKFCGSEFSDSSDFAKVVAWRNVTVNKFNNMIRSFLYYRGVNNVVVGEKLLMNRPLLDREDNPILMVNDDIIVNDIKVESETHFKKDIKFYTCKVKRIYEDGETYTLKILHEDSQVVYDNILNGLKNIAINTKAKATRAKNWKEFYKFKNIFADVAYNYAITAHKCISKGEMICVNSKTKPQWLPIELAEPGDMVRTGKGNFKPILNKVYSGKKKEYILTTKSGHTLKASKDHRIQQFNGTCFEWVRMEDLKIGSPVCMDRNYSSYSYDELSLDKKFWYYGALLGDGSYNYPKNNINRVDLTIGKEDSYLFEQIPYEYNKYTPKNREVDIAVIQDVKLKDTLNHLGFTYADTKSKNFPPFLLECSLKEKASCIRGMMDTDGSADKDRACVRFVNTSEEIVNGLKMLLLDFGIISNKSKNEVYSKKHKQSWVLSITGSSLGLFKAIGFSLKRKQDILDGYKITNKTNTDNIPNPTIVKENIKKKIKSEKGIFIPKKDRTYWFVINKYKHLSYSNLELLNELSFTQNIGFEYGELLDSNFYFDEIVSIEEGEEVDMYDIEVEDDHSFICNGIVVHNSQGSTYNNAFICYSDIMANPQMIEAQRILYTAITRPSETLYII